MNRVISKKQWIGAIVVSLAAFAMVIYMLRLDYNRSSYDPATACQDYKDSRDSAIMIIHTWIDTASRHVRREQ